MTKEQVPTSTVAADSVNSGRKDEAADLLDELFGDPGTVSKTGPATTSSTKSNSEGMEIVSNTKPSRTVTESGGSSLPTLDGASTQSSADSSSAKRTDKDDDSVKSKVKRDDSSSGDKAGSTNKPRKLPDWLAGASGGGGGAGAAASSTSKAPASRKRKAPSKASSTTASKGTPGEDDDSLSSPPPPKVSIYDEKYMHSLRQAHLYALPVHVITM